MSGAFVDRADTAVRPYKTHGLPFGEVELLCGYVSVDSWQHVAVVEIILVCFAPLPPGALCVKFLADR